MKKSSARPGQSRVDKYNYVYMGLNDWRDWERDGFFTRSGAIARALARHPLTNQLLIMGNASSVAAAAARRSDRRLEEKYGPPVLRAGGWTSVYRVDEKALLVAPTKLLPREESFSWAFTANRALHDRSLARLVRMLIDRFGRDHKTILWIGNPLKAHWFGRLDEDLSVFDSIEDLRCHPDKRFIAGLIDNGYRLSRQRADTIFAVSSRMTDFLSNGTRRAFLISNGLDPEIFRSNDRTPADLASIKRPIAGYVGNLQERVDVDLLCRLATEAPHISLVLLGPLKAPRHFSPLRRLRNVHFLGKKPHDQIPNYLRGFDLCLLPHKLNRFTASMDPLKLYEYVAAGKRVVSTCPAETATLTPAITVETERGRFVAAVREQVKGHSEGTVAPLSRYVLDNFSWDSIVDRMLSAARLMDGRP